MTVIATFELKNLVSSSSSAGHSQSAHHSFGAGRNKTEHLDPGQSRRNPFCQFKRIWFAGAKTPGGRDRFLHRFRDVRIAMAQHQRTKALTEVDVLASINGRHRAAVRAAKKHRCAPNSLERAH